MSKTVAQWMDFCVRSLRSGGVEFGHGTDNAQDEAAWLVLHVMGEALDGRFSDWERPVPRHLAQRIRTLIERRVTERRPLAYLLGEAWFCGLAFEVDESVLVPRSPIAELIGRGFAPWARPDGIHRVLDLCTGSGCIAIAIAAHLPWARVDAVDISAPALEVASRNVARHGVADRVRLVRSDLFDQLDDERYDLIVSNPPYVSAAEIATLPDEYRWEPQLGLLAEQDGLQLALEIIRGAGDRLAPGGVLICEVGEAASRLQARCPELPLVWLEFEHGGGGVFTIDRESLVRALSAPDA